MKFLKNLFILCMGIWAFNSYIFADVIVPDYDCDIGAMQNINYSTENGPNMTFTLKRLKEDIQFLDGGKELIFEEKDVLLAHKNLKAYCCQIKKLTDQKSCQGATPKGKYLENPYFMAQLVDLGFRKIDAYTENPYGLKRDENGVEYRDEIERIMKDHKGRKLQELTNLFKDNWKVSWTDGIAQKYKDTCFQANYIANSVFKLHTQTAHNLYEPCIKLAAKRIDAEMDYIGIIGVFKDNKLKKDNMKNFSQKYFVENRWNTLLEKTANIVGVFTQVTEKIHHGVKNCSS